MGALEGGGNGWLLVIFLQCDLLLRCEFERKKKNDSIFFFFSERLELSFTEMRKSVRGAFEVSEGNVG